MYSGRLDMKRNSPHVNVTFPAAMAQKAMEVKILHHGTAICTGGSEGRQNNIARIHDPVGDEAGEAIFHAQHNHLSFSFSKLCGK